MESRQTGLLAALLILVLAGLATAQTFSNSITASQRSNVINLSFINRTDYPAAIFQVSGKKEKLFKTINNGDVFLQSALVSQQWRVKVNGKIVGNYAVTSAPRQEIEITVRQVEAPNKIKNQKDAESQCKSVARFSGDIWIGKWGSLGEDQLSFCEFGYLRSSTATTTATAQIATTTAATPPSAGKAVSSKGVSLIFENQTQHPFQLFKVNQSGSETLSASIPAGSTLTQLTFAANKLKLKMSDGRTLGEYTATDGDLQKIEIVYGGLIRIKNAKNQKDAEEKCSQTNTAWSRAWIGNENEAVCESVGLRPRRDLNVVGPKALTLVFTNQLQLPIQLFRVSPEGQETLSGSIPDEAEFTLLTFADQKWKFKFADGRTAFELTGKEQMSGKFYFQNGELIKIGKVKNQKDAEEKCRKSSPSWSKAMVGNDQEAVCQGIGVSFIPNPPPARNLNEITPKKVSLDLINKTRTSVGLFWVDESGQETSYGQLAAGATQTLNTFASHKWRLKMTNGKSIGQYVAANNTSQRVEIVNVMLEVPASVKDRKNAELQCNKLADSKEGAWLGRLDEPTPGVFLCDVMHLRWSLVK